MTATVDDFDNLLAETVKEGLTDLLGAKPSGIVTKSIAKKLYAKLGLDFVEKSDYGFVEYVRDAMRMENAIAETLPVLADSQNGNNGHLTQNLEGTSK